MGEEAKNVELYKKISELSIDVNITDNEEISNLIALHNMTVSDIVQSLTSVSILNILIDKGIITHDEFTDQLSRQYESSEQIVSLLNNRDRLLEMIVTEDEEKEALKELLTNCDVEQFKKTTTDYPIDLNDIKDLIDPPVNPVIL